MVIKNVKKLTKYALIMFKKKVLHIPSIEGGTINNIKFSFIIKSSMIKSLKIGVDLILKQLKSL